VLGRRVGEGSNPVVDEVFVGEGRLVGKLRDELQTKRGDFTSKEGYGLAREVAMTVSGEWLGLAAGVVGRGP